MGVCTQGQNCLHYAAEYGQVGVMSLLRSLCGESLLVDAKDVWGWTPLHTAVIHGQQQVRPKQRWHRPFDHSCRFR